MMILELYVIPLGEICKMISNTYLFTPPHWPGITTEKCRRVMLCLIVCFYLLACFNHTLSIGIQQMFNEAPNHSLNLLVLTTTCIYL